MLKGVLIVILGGIWSKVVELPDLYPRTFGTQGVASHYLLSARKSLTDAVKEGAFQYGKPGNTSSAALTVQVGAGAIQGADGGLLPLSRKFDRSTLYAAEDMLLEGIKAGTVALIGSKRNGNNLTAALTGNSYRNLYARALLQERALYTLLDTALTVKFPEAQLFSEVKALVHAYRQALGAHTEEESNLTEEEANRLATASEFGSGLTAETLFLAKSLFRFANVATNFLSEFARIVDDAFATRYIHKISALPQTRRKHGEDAAAYYQRFDYLQGELKVLMLPSDIDFDSTGFSVDPKTGIPKILSSQALIIKMVIDYLLAELTRLVPDSRAQLIITAEVFANARQGRLTAARFHGLLRELSAQRIATVPPSETQDATGNTDGLPQHGTFAAAVGTPGGGKGGPALVKPKVEPPQPQDRPRPPGHGAGGARTGRSHSPGTSSLAYYGKSIRNVTKYGPLAFFQKLQDLSLAFGERLFEVDQPGSLLSSLKLATPHSWGGYGGKYGIDSKTSSDSKPSSDLWGALMLARDLCRPNYKLSQLGSKYCSDSDHSWTKAKAVELRGSLTIAGVNDGAGKPNKPGKGGGKGSGAAESKTAAAASWLDDTE